MPNSTDKIKYANAALQLWRGEENSVQPIGESANYVFSFAEFGKKRFLRLTPTGKRTKNQIEAELDFIAFLRNGGTSAMLPIPSVAGNLIERINLSAEDFLLACVFEEAQGEHFKYDSAESKKESFKLLGRTLGQIHALSKTYLPSGDFRRFSWDEDELLVDADKFLPKSEKTVWREVERLKEQLHNYPKSNRNFGLIHGDFGETNYRSQTDRLNVFDFDDCCYHWFAYDIAVTIYPHGWREEGLRLLDWLLESYGENMRLNVTLTDVTMFCQWRLIYMFLVYAQKWGFENLSEQQADWFARKRGNIARGYEWKI